MSLRNRLWLVLAGLFLAPLAVGLLVLSVAVPQIKGDQVQRSVATAHAVVTSELRAACNLVAVTVRAVGLEAPATTPDEAVANAVSEGRSDYAALVDDDGTVVAEAGELPEGSPPPQELPVCTGGGASARTIAERVRVTGSDTPLTAVAAIRLDGDFLKDLVRRNSVPGTVVLLDGDEVVSSNKNAEARDIAAAVGDEGGQVEVDGRLAQVSPPTDAVPYTVVVAQDADMGDDTTAWFLAILLLGTAVAGLLVATIVRGISQPLTELTEAAERVARGELDTRIHPSDDEGEVGRLTDALNQMVSDLKANMAALEQSREDLRVSLDRIGDTLMSTHDLDGLLEVVLETAVVTLQAKAGVVLYGAPDQLHVVAEHGLHDAGLVAPVGVTPGTGVLGRVVSTGEVVRGRLGSGQSALAPVRTEPSTGDVLAVPLRTMGSVLGVLALYDRVDGKAFDSRDEDALRTLAGQASIAIDNVQLHQEAQRLSTTDGLTGLWNFRYLSMSLAREIERSTRFQRPLAVLMLDIDHFKNVNDTYGHARGDAVLRELAQRVQEQIREVDTFARYGGEEFVVVLPETTVDGATQLAERICVAVRREPFKTDGEDPLKVTVSVGGAAFPAHGSSAATLMRAADRALYVAKNEGRDRWHVPEC